MEKDNSEKKGGLRQSRKQITFDLGENKLKMYYPKPSFTINPRYHKKAWSDIAKFMKAVGFEHRQYSVYISRESKTDAEIGNLVIYMVRKMPWLNECLNAIDVTNIGKQHSLMNIVEMATIAILECKDNKIENIK